MPRVPAFLRIHCVRRRQWRSPRRSAPGITPWRTSRRPPVHQLRIYEVHAGNEQVSHERFRDHAVRIMTRHGFKVLATWQARGGGRTEFVYLLEWPDHATMKHR